MSEISAKKMYLEENTIRFVALQVFIIGTLTLIMKSELLSLFLTIDFAIRAFTNYSSPLSFIAKQLKNVLKIKSTPVFAAPKKFAALVGFIFSLSIFLLIQLQFSITTLVVISVLLICAMLESAFKICVGCYVYNWIILPFSKK
jgi:hypothetical protein